MLIQSNSSTIGKAVEQTSTPLSSSAKTLNGRLRYGVKKCFNLTTEIDNCGSKRGEKEKEAASMMDCLPLGI